MLDDSTQSLVAKRQLILYGFLTHRKGFGNLSVALSLKLRHPKNATLSRRKLVYGLTNNL